GVLVGRVQYVKTGGPKKFVILDTGMNHLIRPTLYNAWQFVWPTSVAPNHTPERRGPDQPMPGLETCDVVGPVDPEVRRRWRASSGRGFRREVSRRRRRPRGQARGRVVATSPWVGGYG
ncbi:MAG: hypothetical protein AAGN82_28950, partial [Myxococcota bacterium]